MSKTFFSLCQEFEASAANGGYCHRVRIEESLGRKGTGVEDAVVVEESDLEVEVIK